MNSNPLPEQSKNSPNGKGGPSPRKEANRFSRKRQSSPNSSTCDHSQHHYKLFRASQDNRGEAQIGPIRFVPVAKDEPVQIVPCHFGKTCFCRKIRNRVIVSVETSRGFHGHLDLSLLDIEIHLPLKCPYCQPKSSHLTLNQLYNHMKQRHLLPIAENIMTSSSKQLRCPLCGHKFKMSCQPTEAIEHYDKCLEGPGNRHLFKVLLCGFVSSDPVESFDGSPAKLPRLDASSEELMAKIGRLNHENQQFQTNLKKVGSKNIEVLKENRILLERLQTLEEDLKLSRSENEKHNDIIQKKIEEMAKIDEALRTVIRERDELKEKLKETTSMSVEDEMMDVNVELQRVKDNEQKAIERLNQCKKDSETKVLNNIIRRNEDLNKLETEKSNLKAELEFVKKSSNEELDELREKVKTLEDQISAEKTANEELIEAKKTMTQINHRDSNRIESLKSSLQQKIEELEESNGQVIMYQEKSEELEKKIVEFKDSQNNNESLGKIVQTLEEELEERREEIAKLKTHGGSINHDAEILRLRALLDKRVKENAKVVLDYTRTKKKLDNFEKENDPSAFRQRIRKLEHLLNLREAEIKIYRENNDI